MGRSVASKVKLGFCPAALAPFVTRKAMSASLARTARQPLIAQVGPAFAKRLLCMAGWPRFLRREKMFISAHNKCRHRAAAAKAENISAEQAKRLKAQLVMPCS